MQAMTTFLFAIAIAVFLFCLRVLAMIVVLLVRVLGALLLASLRLLSWLLGLVVDGGTEVFARARARRA